MNGNGLIVTVEDRLTIIPLFLIKSNNYHNIVTIEYTPIIFSELTFQPFLVEQDVSSVPLTDN